ncbi:hypothetical protein LTR05_000605 [Lithohypha guttulata]|uniref:Glycosyl transferase family 1 domain-containing protein n=1 Tax=Lithohypha guttulata TaxID=1690604 RepID=A0AAN7T4S0_9EURO|nr:hypothetical protein LTR05_000605 [Lithohypha guttulata]
MTSAERPASQGKRRHSVQTRHDFVAVTSGQQKRRQSVITPDESDISVNFSAATADIGRYTTQELWAGLAIFKKNNKEVSVGIAIHDGTYSVDFAVHQVSVVEGDNVDEHSGTIENHVIESLATYRKEHVCKLLGAGVTVELDSAAPKLCSRLWAELDIVPVVFKSTSILDDNTPIENVDELADSAARKCLATFAPTKQPRIAINHRNEVQVDIAGQIHLATAEQYQRSVREPTWNAVQKHIKAVKDKNLRIVFFSATPQGGGVALMRHALLRFVRQQGVHMEWFVPKPRPDVFRITKTNHNILQGAVPPDVRATDEQLSKISDWITENAKRYWLQEKGPLRPRTEGGADVIIVDDPQMPQLISIAKEQDEQRPILFRSHIEVRDDLVQDEGSAAAHVWKYMWQNVRKADMFISHPVRTFVPSDVRPETLAWLPATTDWLDGLNKDMQDWDVKYYLHILRQQCQQQGMPQLAYPKRPYITQIARFDPSKGIPDVIKSYGKLRKMLKDSDVSLSKTPQLVLCGHSSIDDPDGSMIFDETMSLIKDQFAEFRDDIIVARLGPSDQMLNAIMSMAKVALQLSTREGFEVKVSEALHKGKPVIASQTGGIPLQIEHGKSGYLVPRGDHDGVAKHLYDLCTDDELYRRMSDYARTHVSDEVHTVGNALSWLYLASAVSGTEMLHPNKRWVNDLAREAAEQPYGKDEPRLPRHLST